MVASVVIKSVWVHSNKHEQCRHEHSFPRQATAIGSKSSPVPEVESPVTVSAAPTETAHKPETDTDSLRAKDALNAASPDIDAPASESGHVIEELMEEPLTTMAWCGRMPRSVRRDEGKVTGVV